MREDKYAPQLDGLRALAVLGVAWSHWAPHHQFGLPFAFGVHLFFVLSGYLITGILLGIRDSDDRAHGIRMFYVRRVLRIVPVYYVTVALAALAAVPLVRESWPWHVAYLSNVFTFLRAEWPGAIGPWWSLSVEEQFYLAWPCLIVFAPRRALRPLILAAIVIAPVFRGWIVASGHPFGVLLTPGALDALGVGALLALAKLSRGTSAGTRLRTDVIGATGAAIVLTTALGRGRIEGQAVLQVVATALFGWLVWRASSGMSGALGRLLNLRPVRYLGRISYGFYLIHNFAWGIVAASGVDMLALPSTIRLGALFVTTLAIAATSWHAMEKPLNDLKRWFPYVRTPAVHLMGASALAGHRRRARQVSPSA
jgi:peptidoglycan/LPS O-acetylase OafA/YrhL